MSGQWQAYGSWLFWTWTFHSGWVQWIPATVQLNRSVPDDTSRDHLERALNRLHQLEGLARIENMWEYTTQQTQWYLQTYEYSQWYYDSIPEYSH